MSNVFDLKTSLDQNFRRVAAILERLETAKDDADVRVQIEAAAELRHNIALAQKALDTALNIEAAGLFEQAVIDCLAEETPRIRKKLIGKLNDAKQKWQINRANRARRPRNR